MGLLDDVKLQGNMGEGSYLRQQFPKLYGALGGLLGTAPDEMQGSVLDANTAQVRQGAELGYLPGLLAGALPTGKVAGLGAMAMGATKGSGYTKIPAMLEDLARVYQETGQLVKGQKIPVTPLGSGDQARPISDGIRKSVSTEPLLGSTVAQPAYSPQYQAAMDAGLDMSYEARMQRAAQQGYTLPVFHGSNSGDIQAFDRDKFRKKVQYMPGVFTADSPEFASNFGDVIYPLLQRQGVSVLEKVKAARSGLPVPTVDSIHNQAAGIHVTNDPANIRSINAAFNPANIGKSDLLGLADLNLLPWLAGGSLLSGAYLNKDK